MKTCLAIFSILLLSINALAQGERLPDFSTMKTDKGMVIVNNNKAKPFVFLAAGKNPQGRQMDDGGLMIGVDERVLYVYFIKTSEFLTPGKTSNEVDTLFSHRDWDIKTQEKLWKSKLNIDDEGFQYLNLPNFQKIFTIYWTFRSPDKENPSRAIYYTTLIANTILMVGSAMDTDAKLPDTRNFLHETLRSLTFVTAQPAAKPKAPTKRKAGRRAT